MRIEHTEYARPGLLPDALQVGLNRILRRGLGILLLVATAFVWLALTSWSAITPDATALGLGRLGWLHLGADVMLQTFGMAAAVALFAPTFWAVEIATSGLFEKPGRRMMAWPLFIFAFSGAFSALPKPTAWPLKDGLGGVVGEFVFQIVRTPFYAFDGALSTAIAFLLLLAAGILGLVVACGLGPQIPLIGGFSASRAALDRNRNQDRSSATAAAFRPDDLDDTSRSTGFAAATDRNQRFEPVLEAGDDTDERREQSPFQPAPTFDTEPFGALDDDPDSRKIAERFAHKATSRGRMGDAEGRLQPRNDGNSAQVPAKSSARSQMSATAAPRRSAAPQFRLPSVKLLARPTTAKPGPEFTQSVLRGNARLLEDVLADFGIKGKIVHVSPGPVVTLYELEPARGVRASRVIALADDIARAMSSVSARIGVIPGKNAIGIELPNIRREKVQLRELLEAELFVHGAAQLPLALGKGIAGEPVIADLARMPHLLIAGTTGSGKSVGINAMILSLIYRRTPAECRLILIDPKMLELSVYNDIPHLLTPVVTDPRKAVAALEWAVGEMEERYKRMTLLNVRSIETFNNCVANSIRQGAPLVRSVQTGFDHNTGQPVVETEELDLAPLPYIVIVIDEMADLMMSAKQEIETAIQRLSQKARAAGIHLITATQRPSVDIVTGTIKANLPARISYKVASKIDSRTILGEQGAEQLLGAGDLLYDPGSSQTIRLHGPFVSDDEVRDVVADLQKQGQPSYVDAVVAGARDPREGGKRSRSDADDLYDRAAALVLRDRRTSVEHLQRRLHVSADHANALIERMERDGVIGAANAAGRHSVLTAAE